MKKFATISTSIVLAGSLLTACGQNSTTSATSTTPSTSSKVTTETPKVPPLYEAQILTKRDNVIFQNDAGKIVLVGDNQKSRMVAVRYEGAFQKVGENATNFEAITSAGDKVDLTEAYSAVYPDGLVVFYLPKEDQNNQSQSNYTLVRVDATLQTGDKQDDSTTKTITLSSDQKENVTLPEVKDFTEREVVSNLTLQDNDKKINISHITLDPEQGVVTVIGKITYNKDTEVDSSATMHFVHSGQDGKADLKDQYYASVAKDFQVQFNDKGLTPNDTVADLTILGLRTQIDLTTGKEVKPSSAALSDEIFYEFPVDKQNEYDKKPNPFKISDSTLGFNSLNSVWIEPYEDKGVDTSSNWGDYSIVTGGLYKQLGVDVRLTADSNPTSPVKLSFYNMDGQENVDKAKPIKEVTLTKNTQHVDVDLTNVHVLNIRITNNEHISMSGSDANTNALLENGTLTAE